MNWNKVQYSPYVPKRDKLVKKKLLIRSNDEIFTAGMSG